MKSIIQDAFQAIDRADFVPQELQSQAYIDAPLPIGQGQTISQPYTVKFMLKLLQPQPGDNILDIGSGSGWQTSLLAFCVSQKAKPAEALAKAGHITALEIVPELAELSRKNISNYNFLTKGIVEAHNMSGENGYPKNAPYDGIIAAASLSHEIPQAWKDQLKIGGKIVTPVQNSIVKLIKNPNGTFQEEEFPGFAFVPFVEKKA